MSEHRTTSRFAVVTGGSEGLGLAIADALAYDGADLILVARNHDELDIAAKELGRHGTIVHTVSADLSAPEAPPRSPRVSETSPIGSTPSSTTSAPHTSPPLPRPRSTR
ncbi:SDR family NAD(P)-dependent oxidoreductase [Streptomyces tendae]|uniref:SDR family NAD(P)-dependent oxidoreductase n=1 Tax=Streptomyces tendae TaxID=1932 RepID=UPI003676B3F2